MGGGTGYAEVGVALATAAERALIAGLMQFYVYDFSELEGPASDRFEPGADGRFAPYPELERYWSDPARAALIIRRGERPAGFALINAESKSGLPLDRNMAEFFVMRKYRRGGVASAAARAILTRFPGQWEIAIARRNAAARAFWPQAIAGTPGAKSVTMVDGDGARWTGPILRFTVGAARPRDGSERPLRANVER